MAMFTDNHNDLDREILLKSNIAKLQKRIEEARDWRSKRDERPLIALTRRWMPNCGSHSTRMWKWS